MKEFPRHSPGLIIPGLIDTHCHLEMDQFDPDREEVVLRAREAGVEMMITIGSDLKGNIGGLELSERYEFIFSAVGFHPHDAKDFTEAIFDQIKSWASRARVVAVGEIGLDYHYDHSPRETQREVFLKQLQFASNAGLPVIIHSREAKKDTLDIVGRMDMRKGVFHCFSGDMEMAEEAIKMGFHISFAGPVTFRNAKGLQEVAKAVPDEYLLIETDAPYLSPEPLRGRRNEPANLVHTAKVLAALRNVSPEDIARITAINAKRLFGIGREPRKGAIAYKIRDSLYLNITNRCTNTCCFCIRFQSDYVKGHNLRLEGEPTEEEIEGEIGDPSAYKEVVFCGYGEPLLRLDVVKGVSAWIKRNNGRVRVNTNGHGNLIHGRNILPELHGLVDSISISLDAHDEETYDRICKPALKNAFRAVLEFIREARKFIPEVQLTVVALPGVEVEECRKIARESGVGFRVRELDAVG